MTRYFVMLNFALKLRIFLAILLLFCFYLVAASILDPDSSWHLRHGTDILQGNFQLKDQYSYTMPSFLYVNHSWLMSVFFALIYHFGGYLLIALFCSIIVTCAVFIASSNVLWLIPLLAASQLFGFGVRSHTASFLMLALLLTLIKQYKQKYKRILYVLPPLLLLWANLHGGFLLGLIYLWGFFLVDILFLQRALYSLSEKTRIFLVFIASTFATLITPYFLETWEEALRTANNPFLKKYVAEWQPMLNLSSFSMLAFVVLFFMSVKYLRRFRWNEIFVCLLLVQSVFSVRMAPLFCLAACFTISFAYKKFLEKSQKKIDKQRLKIITISFVLFGCLLFILETLINTNIRIKVGEEFYPWKAFQYLNGKETPGNNFTVSAWDSYKILYYPEKKTFLDGRMLVWEQKNEKDELDSAIKTYIDIVTNKTSAQLVFDQFCVDSIIWNIDTSPSTFKSGWRKNMISADFTKHIDKTIWRKTYEDAVAVIYERELPASCLDKLH